MQATLTFNLPEEEELFSYYCNTMSYRAIIDEFRNMLRSWDKGGHEPELSQVRELFSSLLEQYNYD